MADVVVLDRHGLVIASILARRDTDPAAIGTALGMDVPAQACWTGNAALMLLGYGPASWLALGDPAPADWSAGLRDRLAGLAFVSDQSSAYAIMRLAGAQSRRALQRGLAIDLHPASFGVGRVAVTQVAHIGAVVWQVDDAPTFDIAVPRSLASSFRRWLDHNISNLAE